ncbi:MAG: hypothetical protein B7X54_03990 [Idiomarina sp. 34-48-12]|nr:MAG: hypothetical protein B7X54_03990 [Idiomarina sp. 34-48-12]
MSIAIIQTQNAKHNIAWHGQDMLLALASMDLNPQLILTGRGIELWLNNHDEIRNNRSLQKRYAMLELFDCPAPWVNQRELDAIGYDADDFIAEVDILDDNEWQQRLAELTKVLTY